MKAFANVNPRDLEHAVSLLSIVAPERGRTTAIAGGGSDLLGMVKERLIAPDVLVNLKSIPNLDRVTSQGGAVVIGGQMTLDALSHDPIVRSRYAVLAEAAAGVGTPQIRNVGTLAGNVCQRPWCWYFRNGFPCLKNGGNMCYAIGGENQYHAIFGGGPSHIVHPSDTAPALVASMHLSGSWAREGNGPCRPPTFSRCRASIRRARTCWRRTRSWSTSASRPLARVLAARTTKCSIARRGPTPW